MSVLVFSEELKHSFPLLLSSTGSALPSLACPFRKKDSTCKGDVDLGSDTVLRVICVFMVPITASPLSGIQLFVDFSQCVASNFEVFGFCWFYCDFAFAGWLGSGFALDKGIRHA